MQQTFSTQISANSNETDIQQQKKNLFDLAENYQNKQHQPTYQIVYDPIQRISFLKQISINKREKDLMVFNKEQTVIKEQNKKEINVIQTIQKLFNSIKVSCKEGTPLKDKIFSVGSIIFHALRFQQFDWFERHFSRYNQHQLNQISQKYLTVMKKCLSLVRFDIENDPVSQKTRSQALECIIKLESLYDSIQPQKKKFQFILDFQKAHIFTLMLSAFHTFQQNYTVYNRTKLKQLFKTLEIESSCFNNSIEVLRFLQTKDPILSSKEPLNQLDLSLQVVKSIDQYMKKNNLAELGTKIALVKVSNNPTRRRVINLLISGFLSEDVDKRQQWNQLLACMPESQVYGLQWQSHTINRLVKFMALSIKDLIMGKDLNELITKDNPFIPAFQTAIQAGHLLAYVVHQIFPDRFVNIIGYSLGSELIRSFLQKSIELNGGAHLNKVITMGGVSDIQEFQRTLQKTSNSINILNVRSKHDSVLKYILKRSKPTIRPIGLTDLDMNIAHHFIQNMDVSSKIKGHFSFMTNFGTIAQLLMLNEE